MTEETRKRFVIVADDYGIRQTAEPILRLVREGKIDRVAVLIHYVSAEQAAALLATGVKIDLHLELMDMIKSGKKVHESALWRIIKFSFRLLAGRVTVRKAEDEWRLQIERFRERFGRLPDGLNSHEHVHFFPPFAKVFFHLAEEYGIGHVRFSIDGMMLDQHAAFVGKILSFLRDRSLKRFASSKVVSSHYLVNLDWLPDFPAFAADLGDEKNIELVVHPEREEEYRILLDYF
jgi:predicted glycoside hydrolase/deacetylase ChbG (UPF0249 family)